MCQKNGLIGMWPVREKGADNGTKNACDFCHDYTSAYGVGLQLIL